MNKSLTVSFVGLIGIVLVLSSCHSLSLKGKEANQGIEQQAVLKEKVVGKEQLEEEVSSKRGIASVNKDLFANVPFARIPAVKRFMMGSPLNERYRKKDEGNEYGPVPVEITKPYEMMKTEVTQRQWHLVMRGYPNKRLRNPSYFKRKGDCDDREQVDGEWMCPDNPVENVSWNHVREFIWKLNVMKGLRNCIGSPQDPRGCYRLPTEAEWEWAVRAGTTTAYFFGNDPSALGRYAIYKGNSGGGLTKVRGNRLPNRFGLYDVYGNVWEWVQDGWAKKLMKGKDPLNTISECDFVNECRVIRGGAWSMIARSLRSANRDFGNPGHFRGPDYRSIDVGFRLVRTL